MLEIVHVLLHNLDGKYENDCDNKIGSIPEDVNNIIYTFSLIFFFKTAIRVLFRNIKIIL